MHKKIYERKFKLSGEAVGVVQSPAKKIKRSVYF